MFFFVVDQISYKTEANKPQSKVSPAVFLSLPGLWSADRVPLSRGSHFLVMCTFLYIPLQWDRADFLLSQHLFKEVRERLETRAQNRTAGG